MKIKVLIVSLVFASQSFASNVHYFHKIQEDEIEKQSCGYKEIPASELIGYDLDNNPINLYNSKQTSRFQGEDYDIVDLTEDMTDAQKWIFNKLLEGKITADQAEELEDQIDNGNSIGIHVDKK